MPELRETPAGGIEVMQDGVWTTVPPALCGMLRALLPAHRVALLQSSIVTAYLGIPLSLPKARDLLILTGETNPIQRLEQAQALADRIAAE